MAAHYVSADPPQSHPNGLFFLVLLHDAPTLAGFQLPLFPPLRQAGPGFTPSFQTDPISIAGHKIVKALKR